MVVVGGGMKNGERRGCVAPLRVGGVEEDGGIEESEEEMTGWGTRMRAMTVRR